MILPLPKGEGRGEGETGRQKFIKIGSWPRRK